MSMSVASIDSREKIAKIDVSNMLGSIEALGKQIEHAWKDTRGIEFTPTAEIRNVVVAGMGGSALGADVILHLFKEQLTVPLYVNRTYSLPNYVDEHTLVLLSSYSGTTEEVLTVAKIAQEKNAQIMVIASGGDLVELATQKNYPLYIIDPIHNPSDQPRMAIGYSVFGTIALLAKAGIISLTDADVAAVVEVINQKVVECTVEVPSEANPAKTLAFLTIDRLPFFVVGDFLEGAAHVVANQHNENAKAFANFTVVPEMNHHLMEGLHFPLSNTSTHLFVFVQSVLYDPKISIRIKLTQQIVEENTIETTAIPLQSSSKLTQVFELITVFSFAGFYLSMLEGIDPSPIPTVDSFKEMLSREAQDY